MRRAALAAMLVLTACAVPQAASGSAPYVAVLIAGDGRLPVFDNAVNALNGRLLSRALVVPGEVVRLSATQDGARAASLGHVLDAVGAMRPTPGQACLVFATSHGVPSSGVSLSMTGEVLSPAALDHALLRGCGSAPTVVVVSACFSGSFAAPPMDRANRTILTAARADRTSFGCGAGRTYTVYDSCLLDAMARADTWQAVHATVRACVAAEERRERVTPSLPQAAFGPAARDLGLVASASRPDARTRAR